MAASALGLVTVGRPLNKIVSRDMAPSELRAPILDALGSVLKPLGYKKTGAQFSRASEEVVHLIQVQASQSNQSDRARFTVNVAIFAMELVYPDVRDVTKPSVAGAHWQARIGSLSPEGTDLWWDVTNADEARVAAADIASRVELYAVPALSQLPSLPSLKRLWVSGSSPGISDRQRKDYLARLEGKYDI